MNLRSGQDVDHRKSTIIYSGVAGCNNVVGELQAHLSMLGPYVHTNQNSALNVLTAVVMSLNPPAMIWDRSEGKNVAQLQTSLWWILNSCGSW